MSTLHNIALKEKLFLKFQGDYGDDVEHAVEHAVQKFHAQFPNYDVNDLQFVYGLPAPHEDLYVFSLGKTLIGLLDDYGDEDTDEWFEVPVMHLSTKNPRNETWEITLVENSCDEITYELYPFEQCRSVPRELIFSETTTRVEGQEWKTSTEIGNYITPPTWKGWKDYVTMKYQWTDDTWLYVGHSHYFVIKNDRIISGFVDDPTHFQPGDCCTICSVTEDKKTLVIENCGDVESLVIIRNVSSP